ncbi:MAG TPA: SDR family oxidoreductase [bacterium]|nr:SDR family oxidoreductase [bacterium]
MECMKTLFDLSGKTALITGSSRGLGMTFARSLATAGAHVLLNGRNKDILDESVSNLHAEGLSAAGMVFDVRNEAEIRRQIDSYYAQGRSIDILVNNAGVQIRGPLEEFTEENWRNVLDVNLTGVFLASKIVVPKMIEKKAGKIINICSVQSELARPTIAPYTASKGGLKMLTKAMATEWGRHNIQVNAIAPGYFKTDMTRALYENPTFNAWLCSRTPANRWGEPGELCGAVVFLASSASNYVNGHILYVDGGLTACV